MEDVKTKVFISWSGDLSRKLAEVIRDWIPSVLQNVSPYFTPSDIEKGSRWSSEIASELEKSKVGIICITRFNLNSSWILFEAGALSKSLQKTNVCPILFGLSNTDVEGPLKQFQTTTFEKNDFSKLMSAINNQLGESKLPAKTLDKVFDKWWPDLLRDINAIISEYKSEDQDKPIRSDRDIIEEILTISRSINQKDSRINIATSAVEDLVMNYLKICRMQENKQGDYQDSLDVLKDMLKQINYFCVKTKSLSKEITQLHHEVSSLVFRVLEDEDEDVDVRIQNDDDDIPF